MLSHPNRLLTVLAAQFFIGATLFATSAAAEPKNQWPFTRPIDSRILAQDVVKRSATVPPVGEAKNEPPFTNPASADPGLAVALYEVEHGQVAPQSRHRSAVKIVPVLDEASPGFNWLDASIGALAALGVCTLGAGLRARRGIELAHRP